MQAICATWAASGECESNKAYMKDNCRPSCKLCTPKQLPQQAAAAVVAAAAGGSDKQQPQQAAAAVVAAAAGGSDKQQPQQAAGGGAGPADEAVAAAAAGGGAGAPLATQPDPQTAVQPPQPAAAQPAAGGGPEVVAGEWSEFDRRQRLRDKYFLSKLSVRQLIIRWAHAGGGGTRSGGLPVGHADTWVWVWGGWAGTPAAL